ncbi:hypothetical protein PQX77_011665 [Marasmius sp. AFHP31]|nr:hypothetical protein PQX77_011665 [Marasmius sp. AFHP31]
MVIRIDERDPRLVFNPNDAWYLGGTKDEYMGTTMGTTTAGAQMSFNFTGTGVEVFGTISDRVSAPTVKNTFAIDGRDPVQWLQPPARLSPQYNIKMFGVRGLEEGVHNLIMEVMVSDSQTWIDYLEVSASTEILTSLSPGVSTSTTQQITSSATSAPTPTRSGTDAGGGPSRGAVAGIAIGAMTGVFLMLLFSGWGLRYRWRRLKEASGGTGAAQLNQINSSLVPQWSTDALLNSQARPFLQFTSTVEKSRNKAEQPPSSGDVSRLIEYRGSGDPELSILGLDDPPPSYASQPS